MIQAKELREVLHFVFSLQFLRMALFWTLSLIISYLHLFIQRFPFSRKSNSYPRCPPANTATFRPLCIITGATSGLGKAAAYALSKEGFYVVLGAHLITMVEIKEKNKNAHLKGFQVDEGTITGKCFSRPKQYPCAHIYEYSKLCLLLFAYELHRQLGCMHNSRHVSVMYAMNFSLSQ
uniref:Uncharacterized protein n=1 Tax=Vitis vinifera TaxID=29760 RepID=A5BLF8_VITVI|nr:hypothetical protein VITISV_022730 [Vitis vinifera]